MTHDFDQVTWDEQLEDDCRQLVRLAVREDLGRECDWTTVGLVPADARASACIVAREAGTIAGMPVAKVVLDEMQVQVSMTPLRKDGQTVAPGMNVACLEGAARDLLTCERILLNFVGHMSGIASLTRRYVDRVEGTKARIYDTRKTVPGWRRLEKYAVRMGGGFNHRVGLHAAALIKDNHLAFSDQQGISPATAVLRLQHFSETSLPDHQRLIVEVEVDSIDQLREVLPAGPDIVLLDNMTPEQLVRCVAIRDAEARDVQLEASGGVTMQSIRDIAESGVDRISVGALTHSAVNFDVALDWDD